MSFIKKYWQVAFKKPTTFVQVSHRFVEGVLGLIKEDNILGIVVMSKRDCKLSECIREFYQKQPTG